jgi:hypothetical protein
MLLSHLEGEKKLSLSLLSRLHHEKLKLILRLFPHVHAEKLLSHLQDEMKTIFSRLQDEKLLPHLHRDKLRLTERASELRLTERASERASLPLRRGREIVTRRMKRRLTACLGSLW